MRGEGGDISRKAEKRPMETRKIFHEKIREKGIIKWKARRIRVPNTIQGGA